MPPSNRLGGRYPSSFGEWIVGTTIEGALASRAKKQPPKPAPKQRDIVRIQVTTDDETEQDSLKVTYPRSGRTAVAPIPTDAVVKKVRFDVAPKKSALKKTVTVSSESEGEASDSAPVSKSEEDSSEASNSAPKSEEDSSEAETSGSSAKKLPRTKRSKKFSCESDSDGDSEPHPTCKCGDCIRGRGKLKKQAKTDESQSSATESEASLSEADSIPKAKGPAPAKSKAKGGKKSPDKSEESGADDEASDSARDSQPEDTSKKAGPDKTKKDFKAQGPKQTGQKTGDGHQKEGQKQGKEKQGKEKQGKEKQGKADKAKDGKEAQPAKAKDGKEAQPEKAAKAAESPKAEIADKATDEAKVDKKKKGKTGTRRTKAGYPEAFPGPHPCRPHLIEPIRAEVVQTERVMERPQDPPPNAYYDPAHGVLRLYHGPVYGGSHGHALYPRQYAAERPLPMGTPHPSQNPYFYGFNQAPPLPDDQAQVPYTQGMPMEPFNAMYPPHALDPSRLSGFPPGGPPGNWQDAGMPVNGNRGAFSMTGANVASPRSGPGDKGGSNNVAPGYYGNPYIPRRSLFTHGNGPSPTGQGNGAGSGPGSNAGQGNGAGSGPGSKVADVALPSNDGACEAGQPGAEGAPGGAPQAENVWGASDQQQCACKANDGQEQQQGWDNQANDSNGKTESNQNSGNEPTAPTSQPADGGGDGWDNSSQKDNPASGGRDEWDNSSQKDNPASGGSGPKYMPGSFPVWGDPSAAASTGGFFDQE
ncbi:hypothetical protein G6O67_008806 [Ophiocordyceps sinensis]|uniref:Uncharacterized protein n=2 Tax=Ophiocordyceps sinensis TaxID=72228 RepID=A0A8H4LR85_9HYPO|nr:hypothetical protein OCS_05849 [Ophiocordyceps sinensis CO18]KAF4503870.1 hypothetical protein G6O67_008806 [Ophiocordyceps sinensis]